MRNYIIYILTVILNYYPMVVFWGMRFAPTAFVGSVILFVLASPLLFYSQRIGLIVALIGCVLMVPYSFEVLFGLMKEGHFKWSLLFIIIPTLLILLSNFFTAKALFVKKSTIRIPSGVMTRVMLAGIPLVIFLLYLVFFGKYWSSQMFGI